VDINVHSKIQVERKGRVSSLRRCGRASPRLSDSGWLARFENCGASVAVLETDANVQYYDSIGSALLFSVLLPSYIVLMNLLRRSPAFVIRTLRSYGPPCVSKARWSSSGPQKNSKSLPSFSLQGKVSHAEISFQSRNW
jgi:hypothetical protein